MRFVLLLLFWKGRASLGKNYILVHPVEAFVEEASKLVPKWNTVTVIEATLVSGRMNDHPYKGFNLVEEYVLSFD